MSAADRSGTERIRRLKAITLSKGPVTGAIDYETLQSIDFGKRTYLRQLANGTVVDENCCLDSGPCINWTETSAKDLWFVFIGSGTDNIPGYLGGIAYGNNRWVAVGFNNTVYRKNILYSTDGVSWQESSDTPIVISAGVAYGNNLWVVVGRGGDETVSNGKNIAYSTDGISWQASSGTPFNSGNGLDIAYGNNLWVAVGQAADGTLAPTGKNILYSIDNGLSWLESSDTPFGIGPLGTYKGTGFGVAYGNNRWVAVGCGVDSTGAQNGKNILYSTDNGVSWLESSDTPFGIKGAGFAVAYANNLWFAVGMGTDGAGVKNGKNILYSTDNGVSWQESFGTPFGNGLSNIFIGLGLGITYGNNLWVAVGCGADGASAVTGKNILYSTDGINWQESPGGTFTGGLFSFCRDIAYDSTHNRWVAIGNGVIEGGGFVPNNVLYTTNPAGC